MSLVETRGCGEFQRMLSERESIIMLAENPFTVKPLFILVSPLSLLAVFFRAQGRSSRPILGCAKLGTQPCSFLQLVGWGGGGGFAERLWGLGRLGRLGVHAGGGPGARRTPRGPAGPAGRQAPRPQAPRPLHDVDRDVDRGVGREDGAVAHQGAGTQPLRLLGLLLAALCESKPDRGVGVVVRVVYRWPQSTLHPHTPGVRVLRVCCNGGSRSQWLSSFDSNENRTRAIRGRR